MAFDPQKFADEQFKKIKTNTGFDPVKFANEQFNKLSLPNLPVKADLTTTNGLYQTAVQSGLKEKADSILEKKGEDVNKIYSGGVISDIFDTLNALDYGVVGALKGKGFTKGVETRESFTKGAKGIPDVIFGTILDIAVDPLTYIAPWTALKKIGVAKKLVRGAEIGGETKLGKWLGRKFVYGFGRDPLYKDIFERSTQAIARGENNIKELTKPFLELNAETQRKIAEARKAGNLNLLPEDIKNKVKPIYDKYDALSKEAIQYLPLSKEMKKIFEENIGKHLRRSFRAYEEGGNLTKFGAKEKGIPGAIFKHRKDLPEEVLQSLGEIQEAGYPTIKSMLLLNKSVENAKFLKAIKDGGFISDIAKDGFIKLPATKTYGVLADKYVPQYIGDDLLAMFEPKSEFLKKTAPIVGGFKFGKVVLNPATHIRNIISNNILNWWKLGIKPGDPVYFEALKQMKRGGKWIEEAKKAGYNLDTMTSHEITDLLLSPETATLKSKFGQKWRGFVKKMSGIYQGEENFAKLAAFIRMRKKGLNIEDAWKAAESATFNYAQVTPFVRKMRESLFGFPFVTFTFKATPLAVETIAKYPRRVSVFGKIKNSIENQMGEEVFKQRKNEPSWVRDGFYIPLPVKDKYGRTPYFDLTYIMPFGDIVSGQFLNPQVGRETGIEESIPTALVKKSPFFNIIGAIAKNQDFYGNKIIKNGADTFQTGADLMRYLSKAYLPPLIGDQIPVGYEEKTSKRRPGVLPRALSASPENQRRTLMEEMIRNVGLKVQPINTDIQESLMNWEKKKALRTLLRQEGVIKDFSIPYQPK